MAGRQAGRQATLCHKMRRQNVVKFLLWRLLIRAAAATLAASAVKHAMQTALSLSLFLPLALSRSSRTLSLSIINISKSKNIFFLEKFMTLIGNQLQ